MMHFLHLLEPLCHARTVHPADEGKAWATLKRSQLLQLPELQAEAEGGEVHHELCLPLLLNVEEHDDAHACLHRDGHRRETLERRLLPPEVNVGGEGQILEDKVQDRDAVDRQDLHGRAAANHLFERVHVVLVQAHGLLSLVESLANLELHRPIRKAHVAEAQLQARRLDARQSITCKERCILVAWRYQRVHVQRQLELLAPDVMAQALFLQPLHAQLPQLLQPLQQVLGVVVPKVEPMRWVSPLTQLVHDLAEGLALRCVQQHLHLEGLRMSDREA
mmetsp:Transcript_43581/g.112603  ORF Transcript_43581/g.112603 Transcript_43581/m.112603 type:complete len:277 (+) Transcript_43581:519-1349(+)